MPSSVLVKFAAEISEFTDGVDQVKDQIEGLTAPLAKIGEAFKALGEAALAAFAVEQIVEGIRHTAEAAEKFGEQLLQVKTQMGTSTEEAAVLAGGMALLGSSAETYTGALFKLERQIKANESAVNALGVQTRDQNGNLLSGTQLMQNAVAGLERFKEGSDRNAASLYLFGRGAQEVFDILRLNDETLERSRELLQAVGVDTTLAAVNAAHEYALAANGLGETLHLMNVKVGQELSPSLTALYETMQSVAIPVFNALNQVIKAIITSVDALATVIANSFRFIRLALEELTDAETLDFTAMKRDYTETLTTMEESARSFLTRMDAIWNGGGKTTSPIPQGSMSFVDPVQAQKAANEAERIALKMAQFDQQLMNEDLRAAVSAGDDKVRSAAAAAQSNMAITRELYQAGVITHEQETRDLATELTQRYNDQVAALNARLLLYRTDEEAYAKTQEQIKRISDQYARDMANVQRQAAQETARQWESIARPIENAFSSTFTGMLMKTQTWQQSVLRLGTSLLQSFISNIIRGMVTAWIQGEAAKTAATAAGEASRTATQAAGAAAGLATQAAANSKSIMNDAYGAASGAYNSASQIPYVGWILGPIAAAAAFAAVAAFGGGVSAEGGMWQVPSDGFAISAHRDESVLPANIAGPMRDFFTGGGAGGGGGNPTVVNVNISAVDSQSVANLFKNNSGAIMRVIQTAVRNGSNPLPAT